MKICVPFADRSAFIKPGDQVMPGIHPDCWHFTSKVMGSAS